MLKVDTVIVGNIFIPRYRWCGDRQNPLTEADKKQLAAAKMPTVNALMSQLELMDDVYWVSGANDDVAISEEFYFLEAVEAAAWIELNPSVYYYGSNKG
ncbi:MAG TPA: hypothetical protein VK211_18050, partial [Kamptonema sp.]|nr:hypothetical protein [Kamptonema sp.]